MADDVASEILRKNRRRRRRRITLIALVILYLLLMTFGHLADRIILFPTTHAIDAPGATPTLIQSGGKTIEVWVARSPAARGTDASPQAFVLEFTGNATRAEEIVTYVAGRWNPHPVEVWVMNYSGYGQSTGPARLSNFAPAALKVYDELARHANGRPIFVAGNSIGTASALYVAANRPVAGAVLQNPPPLRQLIRSHGWWNLWLLAFPVSLQIPSELDSLANAQRTTVPAVFIASDADEVVPPQLRQKVIDAYAGEKRIVRMPGADHNWTPRPSEEKQIVAGIDWLWDKAEIRKVISATKD